MPASATPVCSPIEARLRAQRIFARLMAGQSVRAIAAAESLSVRRVQQIVREHLDRRNSNPAEDFALLQIARLERALDLIGAQIDAGKPSYAHAFVRILEQLNRLAPGRLRLKPAFQRVGDEVDKMEEKLERLDAAREALALRQAESGPQALRDNAAQSNGPQVLDNMKNREMVHFAPMNDSRDLGVPCETPGFATRNVGLVRASDLGREKSCAK